MHEREDFRALVSDIGDLPETQRTALVLREMENLSYEQIAEAMDTTVPSVKSLLVRARVSLAEAPKRACSPATRSAWSSARSPRAYSRSRRPQFAATWSCKSRCDEFQGQLKQTNKALAALLPLGPLAALRGLLLTHLGHSRGSSAAAGTAATGAAGAGQRALGPPPALAPARRSGHGHRHGRRYGQRARLSRRRRDRDEGRRGVRSRRADDRSGHDPSARP